MERALSPSQVKSLRLRCEQEFWFFANATMDAGFYGPSIHNDLCSFLQRSARRKLAVLPRSFLKTTFVNRYLLWRALKRPDIRILVTSNTSTNAEKSLIEIMSLIERHPLISALWPEVIPDFAHTRWSSQKGACLKRDKDYPEATFEAAGVGTAIVRRHYNIIDEDDTIAPSFDDMSGEVVMPTLEEVQKAIGFHRLTTPLLVDARTDEKIFIGTRWGPADVISYIREQSQEGAEHYEIFDRAATSDGTLEGTPIYHRYPIETLREIQSAVGSFLFESLYMNNPQPKDQMSFHQDWIRYWGASSRIDFPTDGLCKVTVDPADEPTGKKSQDYTGTCSARLSKYGLFVKRSCRKRLSAQGIVNQALDWAFEDGADMIRVEVDRHAYLEKAFLDEMNRRGRWVDVRCEKTGGRSKEGRVMALLPLAESGRLFLPEGGVARNLEHELVMFPRGSHDDEADALAWQIFGDYVYQPTAEAVKIEPEIPRAPSVLSGMPAQTVSRPVSRTQITFEQIMEDIEKGNRYRDERSQVQSRMEL